MLRSPLSRSKMAMAWMRGAYDAGSAGEFHHGVLQGCDDAMVQESWFSHEVSFEFHAWKCRIAELRAQVYQLKRLLVSLA